jgi:hypothetical protein
MQTSVFIPDIDKVNLLVARINKVCTIEDAYIVLETTTGVAGHRTKIVNKKPQIYGRLCVFRSVSITQIIDILNQPDELQPEGLIFNSACVKACCLTNNKFMDAFILGCEKGHLESTSKIHQNKTEK